MRDDVAGPDGSALSEGLGVMDETTMDLKATAEKHGLGWLLDPEDEHCHAEQFKAFAFEVARRAAAEGWRWAAKSAADSYNDQVADEAPDHAPDLMAQNVLIGGV